jgi:hypothetical protein
MKNNISCQDTIFSNALGIRKVLLAVGLELVEQDLISSMFFEWLATQAAGLRAEQELQFQTPLQCFWS